MPTDPKVVRDHFLAAAELPVAERAMYLNAHCGDAELRAAVERLLAAHDQPARVLNGPVQGYMEHTKAYIPGEQPGDVIAGRYKLLEAIGEGGMGTVWVAEQTQPVRRKVALKLIKAGMDSKSVLARFEAERQALAVMDHPNIAKVLDGGLTETGRPFFVMEYVKGVPITEYCDATRLSVPERLNLFVQVCQAVQHAHQKGIIHRDLKPSNILVAPYDDKAVPKVIDFGLAKAMHQSLTERTLHTAHETVLGTPLYMSPEQAQLNNLDVDTRSDIYSLGVLLYELLTGTTPLEKKRFKEAAWDEIKRIIREEDPPRPSARLSSSQALPSLAAGRHSEPARLTKLVRGDLDWIVMKSLEKDRSRRYETANGFAADIQRHLAGEPVLAAPPSARYRVRKFARKHRAALTTAAAIALLLVAGVAVSTWQAVRATRAETAARLAEQEARQAQQAEADRAEGERLAKLDAEAQKEQAQKRLAQIEKANDILGSIFENLDPKEIAKAERPLQVILVEKLDQAVAQLEGESIGDPLVVAKMQNKFGLSLLGLGEPGKAIVLLEKARATLQAKLTPEHPDTLTSMNNLAGAYQTAGKLDLALPLFEETLKLRKAKLGPEHLRTLTSMNNLAMAHRDVGKLDLALPLLEETLKLRKAKLAPEHPDTLISMNNLALAYQAAGKLVLALPLFEETLKLTKAKLGPEHPDTLTSMNHLANAYRDAGKLDLGLPLLEETLKLRNAKLGPEHPNTLISMNNLALGYQAAGKLNLALPLFEEAQKLMKAKLGPEHPDTLRNMNNLAAAYWSAKQLDKSILLFEEALKRHEAKLGRNHPDTLVTVANLGVNYKDAGRLAEAVPLLEEAHRVAKKYSGLRFVGPQLLDAYAKAGQSAKLANLLQERVSEAWKALPNDPGAPGQEAGLLAQIGAGLLVQKKSTEAEPLLRECLAIREKTELDAWTTFNTKSLLGGAMLGQKKYADAEPLLLAGYEGMKQREKSIPEQGKVRIPEAIERLVQLYEATDKKDDAAKWRKELEAIKTAEKKTEKQP